MPTPIIETFAAALKTQLETITTASGYNYTATVVRRAKRAMDPAHLQIRIEQPDREQDEGPEGTSNWLQPFVIKLVLMPQDSDATALDTHKNLFSADVEKSLNIDAADSWWTSVSGVANVELEGPLSFEEDEGYDGCEFVLKCHYRHVRGDPTTA